MAETRQPRPTACLALADGTVFYGMGFGATGETHGRALLQHRDDRLSGDHDRPVLCGTDRDLHLPACRQCGRQPRGRRDAAIRSPTAWSSSGCRPSRRTGARPSGCRTGSPSAVASRIGGVDTRRLTRAIRQQGAPHVALAHDPDGNFDIGALVERARGFPGLTGRDLARDVTCAQSYRWDEMRWAWPEGYVRQTDARHRVVAIDYGAKRNILRSLASAGCDVTVLPATATAEDVLAQIAGRRVPVERSRRSGRDGRIRRADDPRRARDSDIPMFGICLGHQMLALALGAQTHQDEPRPPRREPSGQGDRDRQGRDHLDEPRLRGRQPVACPRACSRRMSRSSTARTAASG